jgi:hypothetical protein
MQAAMHRFSRQIRPIHPEADADIHPRAVEMAEAMREGADTFRALQGRGFSAREITDFREAAAALARENSVRHLALPPDRLEDIVDKAKVFMPNRPPLPRGLSETQAVLARWGRYCMARHALVLDPHHEQRERCLKLLADYLGMSQMYAPAIKNVVDAVAAGMPKVTQ